MCKFNFLYGNKATVASDTVEAKFFRPIKNRLPRKLCLLAKTGTVETVKQKKHEVKSQKEILQVIRNMESKFIREIFYYKNYYLDFFEEQTVEVKKKFNWTLQLISTIEKIPQKYFKHITDSDGIYEIRIEVGSNIYRVFSFFDEDKIVILLNGFQKKTQKTPKNQIKQAEKLKKEYFYEKNKQ